MKEGFRTEEVLEDCAGAEILFICRTDFSEQELRLLKQYSERGTTLFFTEIPSETALEDKSVRDLLGIDTYKGIEQKKGIRLTENLLFGEIAESKEAFTMKAVTLKRQTEVYGSALQDKKVKNEKLAPVFWRYQDSIKGGSVYVADRGADVRNHGLCSNQLSFYRFIPGVYVPYRECLLLCCIRNAIYR